MSDWTKDNVEEYCKDLEVKVEEQAGAMTAMRSCIAAYGAESEKQSAEIRRMLTDSDYYGKRWREHNLDSATTRQEEV